MRTATIAAAVAILALAPGAARGDKVPEAAPAGEPVSCVSLRQIRDTRVHSDTVIDFRMRSGGQVYRNTLPMACPQLGTEKRILYKTSGSELCDVDTITVLVGTGMDHGASCGLGKFQPVTPVKR